MRTTEDLEAVTEGMGVLPSAGDVDAVRRSTVEFRHTGEPPIRLATTVKDVAAEDTLIKSSLMWRPAVPRRSVAHDGEPRLACMPSYRVELEIGALRPGTAPREVMDTAVASFGSLHVDATDLKVSDGTPFILVRFTVPASSEGEEDRAAEGTARRVGEAVGRVAVTGRHQLLRRRGGDWVPVS